VQPEGTVYAIDQDHDVLDRLMQIAASQNLNRIIPLSTLGTAAIALDDDTIDVVLLYDVIHYSDTEGRGDLYREVYRILKPGALLSVYPKHHQSDWPLSHLADRTIDDIIKEIEAAQLSYCDTMVKVLIHDDCYTQGHILNFRKIGEKGNILP
jgi:SAM-dependent methyltransferase